MTAEERNEVCKELLEWAENADEAWRYMEERIYAINMPFGRVMLVKANSYREALDKAYFPTGGEKNET